MRLLVMRGYFRSYDKKGGHTIRSAVAENSICVADTSTGSMTRMATYLRVAPSGDYP